MYYPIDETTARRSHEMMSMMDYHEGSATAGYRAAVDEAAAKLDEEISGAPPYARTPYPDFELTSLRGKIKRVKENLAKLDKMEAAQGGPDREEPFDGGRVVHNVPDNRLQILFDGIPGEKVRAELKSHGFRWSRRNQAWQRQLTNNAIYDARHILGIGGKKAASA